MRDSQRAKEKENIKIHWMWGYIKRASAHSPVLYAFQINERENEKKIENKYNLVIIKP